MGEMRDSDWSRPNLLRSDWLGLIGATMTTSTDKYSQKKIALSNRKRGLFHIRYFENGPLEPA